MSDNQEPMDLPEQDQDKKEQTVLEQLFTLPGENDLQARIDALNKAISTTEEHLNDLGDDQNKEKAHFGRQLQKLKRMLQASLNKQQRPDDQITVAAPGDLKPIAAQVSVDEEDVLLKAEPPKPEGWEEEKKHAADVASSGQWKLNEEPTASTPTADVAEEDSSNDEVEDKINAEEENNDIPAAVEKNESEEQVNQEETEQASPEPQNTNTPVNTSESTAAENTESESKPEEDDDESWADEATMQMDAPKFDNAQQQNVDDDEEWTDEATLQMDAPQFNKDKEWDGTEATLQMDTGANKNPDWDGTEATLQMDTGTNKSKDWDGTEVTLQMDTSQDKGDISGTDITLQMGTPNTASRDWDGTEATVQMNTGGQQQDGDWDGSEATMQMGTGDGDWDGSEATIQNMPSGKIKEDTQATFIPRKDSDTATDATILTDQSKPKTQGATSSKGMDAGWHLKGRKGPATGEMWGEYEIGGVLGEGGMGLVYRAKQMSLNRKCAVKVLAPHLAADDKVRERFELEAQTTSLLVSPNIVNVFAAGVSGDNNYFVMEYVDGEDLSDKIKERGREGKYFSCDEATDLVVQAARGLAEAARHGIVHRDIKPGNLMVTNKNEVKIADFGIVKVMGESSLTMTGQAVGTPSYLSPEQGRGDEVDQRSDLYSLGVVFYQLITGQRPFDGTTPNALIYQHNFEEPKMPQELVPTVTDDIQAVVIKLLSKKPENRYQKAEELIRDLEEIQEGHRLEALLAEKLSTGADEARKENLSWAQRNLLKIVAVVAAALLVVGIWGFNELQSKQARDTKRAEINDKRSLLTGILDSPNDLPNNIDEEMQKFDALISENKKLSEDNDAAKIAKWQVKIDEIRALKKKLAVLDETGDDELVLFEMRNESIANLAQLELKIGTSPQFQAWNRKVTSTLEYINTQKEKLSAIERTPKESMKLINRKLYQKDIEELQPLLETEEVKDSDLERWRASLVAFDAFHKENLDALKSLLDENLVLKKSVIDRQEGQLKQLTITLGEQNDLRKQYRRILDNGNQKINDLNISLGRLSSDESKTLTVVEDASLRAKLAEAVGLEAIGAEKENRYNARLERDKGIRAALKERLKIVDQKVNFDHLANDIKEFSRVMGENDPDAKRYTAKLAAVKDLRIALRHLDEPIPLQEDAAANIKRLIDLIGEEDNQVAVWKQKVEKVGALLKALTTLDEVRPIPDNATNALNVLKKEIGGSDERVQRWTGKIAHVEELKTKLSVLPGITTLPIKDLYTKHAEFKDLVNNIGMDDPDLVPWARRLAIINGPGKPAWAQTYGRDNYGVWAEIHIPRHGYQDEGNSFEIDPRSLPDAYDENYLNNQKFDEDKFVKLRFRFIPSGSFIMGADSSDPWQEPDENQISNTITKSYWIADTEVTQEFWQAITGSNPSLFKQERNPVERVSWKDSRHFFEKINKAYPQFPARLPTESEWERACKAGFNSTIYAGPQGPSDVSIIDEIAWHRDNSNKSTHNVGVRQPNALGLHDMHGNVWEWCSDGYNSYPTQDAVDFVGVGEKRVARGGSWGDSSELLRATNRLGLNSKMRSGYLGIRLAVDVEWPQQQEPDGSQMLAVANEVLEQIKIDEKLGDNVRLFFQLEWPKNKQQSATDEQDALILDSVGKEQTKDTYETSTTSTEPNDPQQAEPAEEKIDRKRTNKRKRGKRSRRISPKSSTPELSDLETAELLSLLENESTRINWDELSEAELLDLIGSETTLKDLSPKELLNVLDGPSDEVPMPQVEDQEQVEIAP